MNAWKPAAAKCLYLPHTPLILHTGLL
jgi:hypothetical protein